MKKLWIAILFLLVPCFIFASPYDYTPKFLSPTNEVVTPHLQWLKPNRQGPLKVLFITYRGGMREVVELSQRMDIQYTVFALWDQNAFYVEDRLWNPPNVTLESMTTDGEEKLKASYDAIILGNINWSVLPMPLRYQILLKVKGGTGLLGVVSGADEYLKKATAKKIQPSFSFLFPYKGLPAYSGCPDFNSFLNSTLDAYQFGKGKILLLKVPVMGRYTVNGVPYAQALTPGAPCNPLEVNLVEYDYYLAYICHLLLVAGNKEPPILIKGQAYLQRDRTITSPIKFIIDSKEEKEISCQQILRNKDNEVVSSLVKKISLSSGETTLDFDLGNVPAGNYFADIWVKEGKRTINFGSAFVEVGSDPGIAKIEIKKDCRQEESISGTITVTNKTGEWDGVSLKIQRKDNFGRIISRETIPLDNVKGAFRQERPFRLPASTSLSIIQYIEAELCKSSEILDKRKTAFCISNLSPKDDIRYILWVELYTPGTYLLPHFYAELYRAGFDTTNQFDGWDSHVISLANLYYMLMGGQNIRIWDKTTPNYANNIPRTPGDHNRYPSLNDPEYRKNLADNLTKAAERASKFSTLEYNMGDECNFSGGEELCFAPSSKEFFRKFLKEEYSTLEQMNKEYNSNYKSFNEVEPVLLKGAKENPKLIPLWVDFRRAMESQYADIYAFCRDTIQKVVPEAKTGYEGSPTDSVMNSLGAIDLYKLAQVMRLNNPYDAPFMNYALADFAQPGTLLGLGWYGGYNPHRSEMFNRYISWRHLFRGANSFWVFHAGPSSVLSIISPDFSFYDSFKSNPKEVKEIKGGIGKLIISSKRANDKIAILYSASSLHASTLTEEFPEMHRILNSLVTLLEDTGCQFQIISYKQLEDGILNKDDFCYLILPFTQALSEKESEEIISFVKNGKTVIADLRPGVCDQHGKPYEKGALDEVFGIQQNTQAPKAQKGVVSISESGFPARIQGIVADASLRVTTGQIKAKIENIPGLIVNKYGNGTAILLNFSFSEYVREMREFGAVVLTGDAPAFKTCFKALLSFAGSKVKVMTTPPLPGLRTYRFANGSLEYLGVLQELPELPSKYALEEAAPIVSSPVTLNLLKKYHIYNVREGKYLGETDTIQTTVEPARAQLYSLLPYRVKSMQAILPDKTLQGKKLAYQVMITATDPVLGLHVIHLALISPEGKEIPYYSENLAVKQGRANGTISLSFNEMPGKWKLKIVDIGSGVSAEQPFIVEEVK